MQKSRTHLKARALTRVPGIRLRSAASVRLVLAWLAPSIVSAATFTASLDRNPIHLGESATLSIRCEGGTLEKDPAVPGIPNLQIAYIGPSSQFSVINGQVSSSVTYNYNVQPRQPGDYLIPAITGVVGGQKLSTEPLKLTVLKPGTPPPGAAASESEPAMLKLTLPKKEVYVGETFVAELRLLLSDKVQNFGNFRLTGLAADGFNVGKMAQAQRRSVRIGNSVYAEIPIQIALTPVKNGPLNIGPITASLVLELPSARRRRDPIWDPFGMLGSSEQRAVALATDSELVQALALPAESAPPNFNGVIGNYSMTVTASPTNLAVGDPITVKVQIAGSGTFDSLSLPDQPAWRDFKIYPSTPKSETSDPLGLNGRKTFEEVLVPQNTDIKELPPVSFSYFDVETKQYRTLTGPAIALAVRPAGAASVPVIAAGNRPKEENAPPAQDVVSIKQHIGRLAAVSPPLVQQSWFLALQSVPALALLGCVIWRKRSENLAKNPRLRRRRQVAQLIREGRNDLRRFAAGQDAEQFFATLFRLLQEQLGERLDLPASAITEAVIEEHLRPAGVPEPTLADLHELFQSCNVARYAPVQSSHELAAFIPRVETTLRQLREVRG